MIRENPPGYIGGQLVNQIGEPSYDADFALDLKAPSMAPHAVTLFHAKPQVVAYSVLSAWMKRGKRRPP